MCVTIPAQWNSSFREVYLNVLAEAFDIHRETLRLQQLAEDAGLPRPHFERDIHDREQSSATRAGDHLRLVCDPFLGQDFKFDGWNNAVPRPTYKRTYDLLDDLPVPTSNGKFECQIDFRNKHVESGGMMILKLKIIPEKAKGQGASPPTT
ncbi:hypothetical protein B0H65DRAFT_445178 [Neurospora tetraspora]|uniref:Uncharacterized protein n=1 Tax=Neurospora tetraspora TaxID=94610 RepID=A0AAE0J8A4_9PEZI|nr:hypothetical protein B0H65DRAFT_445178 [Neurospora tetraspora]